LALGSFLLDLGSWLSNLGSWLLALGFQILALGSWLLAFKYSTLGSTVCDVLLGCGVMVVSTLGFSVFEIFREFSARGSAVCDVLLGCGVMVVSTLGFRVFEIFLEYSDRGSAVCNVLLGCSVMVLVCPWFPPLAVVGTFVPIVTSFFIEEIDVIFAVGWPQNLLTFSSRTSSLVFDQVSI
jgi:hypothetical protein